MRITARDRNLLADLALHQVMTGEQVVRLGYFSSSKRANARLLQLRKAKLLRLVTLNPSLESRQHLYAVAAGAVPYLDSRIVSLLRARSLRPRHVEHALAILTVRIELLRLGAEQWLAEPQVRHRYQVTRAARRQIADFRPDGLAFFGNTALFLEVDQGQVSLPRFRQKLATYADYVRLGVFASTYGAKVSRLLIVTTGQLRKRHISRCLAVAAPVPVAVETYTSLAEFESLSEVSFQ